jgi:ribose 1,5-bisphosphokinase
VTKPAAILGDASGRLGPGRLVLVVGPSGAGKDTLLDLVRAACADDSSVVFPKRMVTREASSSEDNESISPADFAQAIVRGEFAVQWQAHGLYYGLPRSIIDDIRAGRTVVANVSRTVIASCREMFANVTVVSVTAPPDVLAQRLAGRARDSDGQLDDRLRRTVPDAAFDVVIDNVGRAEDHASELLRVIKG